MFCRDLCQQADQGVTEDIELAVKWNTFVRSGRKESTQRAGTARQEYLNFFEGLEQLPKCFQVLEEVYPGETSRMIAEAVIVFLQNKVTFLRYRSENSSEDVDVFTRLGEIITFMQVVGCQK